MSGILDGLKVLDVGSWVAGPAAATVLADYGADVVKVEPPVGDPYRHLLHGVFPFNPCYEMDGRNKRSLAVDLQHPEGQALVQDLAVSADVLVTNFRPGLLARLGLDWQRLSGLNPRLVFAQITAYGLDGPDAPRSGFDTTAWWGRSGMQDFIRGPGAAPVVSAGGMGDHATAMSLFGAIMLALYARQSSGRGQLVDTSLLANGVWSHGMTLSAKMAGHDWGALRQEQALTNPLANLYQTRDNRWVHLSMLNPVKEFPLLCQVMGYPVLVNDPRFATPEARREHVPELAGVIAGWFASEDLAAAHQQLDDAGVTHGVAASAAEVLADPQLSANGMLRPFADAHPGMRDTIAAPINLSAADKAAPVRAPGIGEHSAAVLLEAGMTEDQLADLLSRGVVVQGAAPDPDLLALT